MNVASWPPIWGFMHLQLTVVCVFMAKPTSRFKMLAQTQECFFFGITKQMKNYMEPQVYRTKYSSLTDMQLFPLFSSSYIIRCLLQYILLCIVKYACFYVSSVMVCLLCIFILVSVLSVFCPFLCFVLSCPFFPPYQP